MKKSTLSLLSALTLVLSTAMSNAIADEDWPFIAGDFWDVAGIDVMDGGDWKYANWLADQWRKNQEFAKSKGWIKDYMVMSNVHNREGEPDLYLITVQESVPSGAEFEKRSKVWREFQKKSFEKLVDESGNRAEYRHVMGSSLLQVLKFRD